MIANRQSGHWRWNAVRGLGGGQWLGAWLLVLLFCFGCGSGAVRAPVSDVDEARELLVKTLDAWQEGQSANDLKARTPPIYYAEDLIRRGNQLVGYTLDGEPELYGTNVRINVTLEVTGGSSNSPRRQQVTYLVATTPAFSIAREE